MNGNRVVVINNLKEAEHILKSVEVDSTGIKYMSPKAVHRLIMLKDIPCRLANIIKQEMLSKGGEAAVSRNSIYAEGTTDILLMATLKQYSIIIEKLKIQPFKKMQEIAVDIEYILKTIDQRASAIELANGSILELGNRTLIMGILNVTPDSFSDGGNYLNPETAVKRALKMVEQGADIIDIGGASSRPNSTIVDEQEELNRVIPVVERLAKEDIIISVDTFRAKVAEKVLDLGAHIINDIGRLKLDSNLIDILVEKNAPVILMHNRLQMGQGEKYNDLISDILIELDESIEIAKQSGLKANKIILDPGIGFGKTVSQNRLIIKKIKELKSLGKPVLIGASRKSFVGKTLDLEVDERLEGSLAIAALAVANGADILRVHDVLETKRIVSMTDAVINENG
ncbi:Dihydropteroate synthase [Candidatus Syntrophocurvum alkaliphilum]|uniref:Dihydropteroate synthase n=1 Tax=Candidatus Syntrophocurvum alkaliphilum TaxID=2293317 RepID=A0A6I6DHE3_9FIRM|nr:dihydropteroate synthase [Candidatus Syntrophocurvum alkaliphilum]QGU00513.1 Dihydropteroate synthase [Candidatus Syntrophocurvum alkaliphilum]